MSTYDGWQDDLLASARLPKTKANHDFLTAWHENAESDCQLNPIDLTTKNDHSHHCKDTGRYNLAYQKYDSKLWTRTAFAAQIAQKQYRHLRGALQSGNPYTVSNFRAVQNDIGWWQSQTFSNVYATKAEKDQPSGTISAPQALGGWKELRKSINRAMPKMLAHSTATNRQTLRTLHRARKVMR